MTRVDLHTPVDLRKGPAFCVARASRLDASCHKLSPPKALTRRLLPYLASKARFAGNRARFLFSLRGQTRPLCLHQKRGDDSPSANSPVRSMFGLVVLSSIYASQKQIEGRAVAYLRSSWWKELAARLTKPCDLPRKSTGPTSCTVALPFCSETRKLRHRKWKILTPPGMFYLPQNLCRSLSKAPKTKQWRAFKRRGSAVEPRCSFCAHGCPCLPPSRPPPPRSGSRPRCQDSCYPDPQQMWNRPSGGIEPPERTTPRTRARRSPIVCVRMDEKQQTERYL